MKVIVGLGNPGPTYQLTRHNAGFQVLDWLGTKFGGTFSPSKNLKADTAKLTIDAQSVLLVKPTTFMNLSGTCVTATLHWYKAELKDLLVIHDDVSLPLGRIRLQNGGGAGGQHGIESIIESFGGEKDFDRIKVGVGPDPGGDVRADYVLAKFPEVDKQLHEAVIELTGRAILAWLATGIKSAMNEFNGMDLRPLPETPNQALQQ